MLYRMQASQSESETAEEHQDRLSFIATPE